MKNDSENFITNNEKSADAIGERKTNNGFLLAFSLFCASLITKQACRSISASGWLYDTVTLPLIERFGFTIGNVLLYVIICACSLAILLGFTAAIVIVCLAAKTLFL